LLLAVHNLLLSFWIYRLVRFVLGGIFVWAGAAKLMAPRSFAAVISQYGLVPDELLVMTAIGLPVLEVIGGIGLLFDYRASLEVIGGLLLLFIGVLWFGILKDLNVDCGCFSLAEQAEHASLRTALYRDLVLLVQVLYLFWWRWCQAKGRRLQPQGVGTPARVG
jgi:uncharacterized membrane protein YphA (DoxX/SURF4 family)